MYGRVQSRQARERHERGLGNCFIRGGVAVGFRFAYGEPWTRAIVGDGSNKVIESKRWEGDVGRKMEDYIFKRTLGEVALECGV